MADCKRCDRCGSYYEESDTFKRNIPKITKEKIKEFKTFEGALLYSLGGNVIDFGKIDIRARNGNWLGPIDLCPKCGEEFCNWLMNEEDNDGKPRTETSEEKT